MAENDKKLTGQQALFISEYLIDLNATQAAIRAGYSEASAAEMGSENLRKPHIASEIQKAMDKRSEKICLRSEDILKKILDIADVDIGDAYDRDGRLLNIKEMPLALRKSISSIKVFEEFEGFGKERVQIGEVREVKFWDKVKSLELLGKHLKLFTEKIEHSTSPELAQQLARARVRAEKK